MALLLALWCFAGWGTARAAAQATAPAPDPADTVVPALSGAPPAGASILADTQAVVPEPGSPAAPSPFPPATPSPDLPAPATPPTTPPVTPPATPTEEEGTATGLPPGSAGQPASGQEGVLPGTSSPSSGVEGEIATDTDPEADAATALRLSAGIPVDLLAFDMPMPWGYPDFETNRVSYLSQGGRRWLFAVMSGSLPYLDYIVGRVEHYGLPRELIYLPVVESEYTPGAVSRSGATGLWQFMKNSIAGYGMRIDDWVDERKDFMKSTDGALRKLADNHRALGGDWYLALAAYNAGLGAVTRAIAKSGMERPGFADLVSLGLLPRETVRYVPKFLAVASILRYPELHGLPGTWGEPSRWHALPSTRQIELSLFAERTGIPLHVLRAGNPELRHEVTPPTTNHFIKVPADKAEAAKVVIADDSRPLIRFHTYKVKSGDNLGRIARSYKVSVGTVVGANPGLHPDRIQVGQILKIPAFASSAPAAGDPRSTGDTLSFTGTHVVVKGDTIWNISLRYKIQPEVLAERNGLTLSSIIRIGQKLVVPVLN